MGLTPKFSTAKGALFMSQDFTTILSSEFINPAELLVRIEQQLSPLAFRKIPPIYRVEFDEEREVFDETDSDEVSGFEMIEGIKEQIAHWQGNAINFQSDDFSFYLLIGATDSKFINCYVDITERTIRKLFEQEKIAQYYAILGIIARCCQASGGYGAIELPFSPIAPHQVINAIWKNPENPDGPSSIGLIPEQSMNQATLDIVTQNPFTLTDRIARFWILAEKDYLSFFKKQRRAGRVSQHPPPLKTGRWRVPTAFPRQRVGTRKNSISGKPFNFKNLNIEFKEIRFFKKIGSLIF